ncbi:hypothetical protein [Crocinitomix algicola]|uniref:hypothetical protein n=1 Tax=Crocinitomix algicola TaxID=1740263 RepID=UPI00082F397C|nr:hypothetical protein [Crocinitomix algicola]
MKLIGFVMIIATVLLSVSCKKNKDKKLTLPPATQTGENTLGFLIDDQVWIANGGGYYPSFSSKSYNSGEDVFGMISYNTKNFNCTSRFFFTIFNFNGTGTYTSNDIDLYTSVFYGCSENFKYPGCKLDTSGINSITITYFSLTERIASGTFNLTLINPKNNEQVLIRDGRFDVGGIGIY